MRLTTVVICVMAALVTWLMAFAIAATIPGTAFHDIFDVVNRLSDPRTGPSAFEDFLDLGKRTMWISSTVFPIAAAGVVVLLSRWRLKLRRNEAGVVVALFVLIEVLVGAGSPLAEVVSGAIFAAV